VQEEVRRVGEGNLIDRTGKYGYLGEFLLVVSYNTGSTEKK